ncbi:MAG: sodium transporter, partial [Calditrichaeota bacterium]|nr:sodium transporter [Calditrichota bacterium]
DQAYAVLLKSYLLPAGLKGLVFAGVLAALMSSLAASFISISTLFTMDFYRHFDPQAPEKKLVLVGRLTATAIVAVSILWIPLFKQLDSHLYIFLQSIQSYISPPIAAVFLLGIFFRRGNGKGAMWALVLGGLIGLARIMVEWMDPANIADISLLFWLREINYLHFAIYLFVFSILIMITASLLSEAPFYSRIRELTFSGGVAAYALDSARGKRFNWMISATLVVVLFGLWGVFS